MTVAIVDTGADRSVISARGAKTIGAKVFGRFEAKCASDTILEGKLAEIDVRDIGTGKSTQLTVGVTDIPFDTDDINDEGVEIILGVDYLQAGKSRSKARALRKAGSQGP